MLSKGFFPRMLIIFSSLWDPVVPQPELVGAGLGVTTVKLVEQLSQHFFVLPRAIISSDYSVVGVSTTIAALPTP
jgi:hypothetical protein